MFDNARMEIETARSLRRLMPRIDERFHDQIDSADWQVFASRLNAHFPDLFRLLIELHGSRYDFFYHLEQVLALAATSWLDVRMIRATSGSVRPYSRNRWRGISTCVT